MFVQSPTLNYVQNISEDIVRTSGQAMFSETRPSNHKLSKKRLRLELIKIKSYCTTIETMNKMKRHIQTGHKYLQLLIMDSWPLNNTDLKALVLYVDFFLKKYVPQYCTVGSCLNLWIWHHGYKGLTLSYTWIFNCVESWWPWPPELFKGQLVYL